MRKTGGGPHPSELKPWEEKIVAVLSSEVISGVEGGYDSLDTDDHISGTSVGLGEKRKLDEMILILIEGFEVPISESKRPSSCATSNEPERFVQQFVPSCTRTTTCGEGSSKRQRYIKKDVVGNSSELSADASSRGCPFRPSDCSKYCSSKGYISGICGGGFWKSTCVCYYYGG
uniref:Uncharacterized protein LOC111109892 n=1 Tax=Crassostrea virginica TaxID=6565 RepID=A0A8B8BFR3_CRAVI|nr:uncharacterized protein LOC111109892 [Crassostrea virginica]